MSALPNQGPRHWVNETGLGVGVGVGKGLCDPSLLPSRKDLLRNVRTTEVVGWPCSPLPLGALPSGDDTTSAPIDAVCEDASTASAWGGPSVKSPATEADGFTQATF